MSVLTINSTTNLSQAPNVAPLVVSHLCMGHEPTNELVQYYIYDAFTNDKESTYPILAWQKPGNRLTSREVQDIGIKSFPGIGAFGFFKYKHNGKSMVLVPINHNPTQYKAPVLAMSTTGTKVTFTIVPPADITYECYRIILRSGYFAYEYITYRSTLEIDIPDVNGTYSIVCIGYTAEGKAISHDSNELSLVVTTGHDSFVPSSDMSYYTKDQIDAMLGQIATLLDTINGEVV
ncbi:MAG: hypothetical protein RR324_01365 [Cellulosilyticaceae bacterium]